MKAHLGRADTILDEAQAAGATYSDKVKIDMIFDSIGMALGSQKRTMVIVIRKASSESDVAECEIAPMNT